MWAIGVVNAMLSPYLTVSSVINFHSRLYRHTERVHGHDNGFGALDANIMSNHGNCIRAVVVIHMSVVFQSEKYNLKGASHRQYNDFQH